MNLGEVSEGISILRGYFDEPDGHHIGAEHDQIFIFRTDRPVSEGDVARLRDLGWFQPDIEEDAPYDPEEPWCAFV
ncbi:hypothetical protein [Falsiroseomonas sp. CW058]|uniref:hypothetical protein n=1 Tax=Falsiroseomonas sp. CW058 TaxID=3388664 RepID=UPI003D3181FD